MLTDEFSNLAVPFLGGMNRVSAPYTRPVLAVLPEWKAGIHDGKSTEAVGEQEVFVKSPTLGQALAQLLLKPFLLAVCSMVAPFPASPQVSRKRGEEDDSPPF